MASGARGGISDGGNSQHKIVKNWWKSGPFFEFSPWANLGAVPRNWAGDRDETGLG